MEIILLGSASALALGALGWATKRAVRRLDDRLARFEARLRLLEDDHARRAVEEDHARRAAEAYRRAYPDIVARFSSLGAEADRKTAAREAEAAEQAIAAFCRQSTNTVDGSQRGGGGGAPRPSGSEMDTETAAREAEAAQGRPRGTIGPIYASTGLPNQPIGSVTWR